MEEIDIAGIKESLIEEQKLETQLKKHPNESDTLLPLLNRLYRARMNLERANWGCSVDRDRFALLKSSLLEEAHLEELLDKGKGIGGNGLNQDGDSDSDIAKLLKIAKDKSQIYTTEVEANIDPTVACPLLPKGETPASIADYIRTKTRDYIERKKSTLGPNLDSNMVAKKVEKKKKVDGGREERKKMVRYIMGSTK